MTASNHTKNYNLSQFAGTDRPTWLKDYNGDMARIDAQMKRNADDIASATAGRLTTSALTSGLAGKVDKSAAAPNVKGLTAAQLDALWLDGNGIVRVTE